MERLADIFSIHVLLEIGVVAARDLDELLDELLRRSIVAEAPWAAAPEPHCAGGRLRNRSCAGRFIARVDEVDVVELWSGEQIVALRVELNFHKRLTTSITVRVTLYSKLWPIEFFTRGHS